MTKLKFLGLAVIATMFLASCGGGGNSKKKNESVQVKAEKTRIKGKLSKNLEVVSGTYKISKGDGAFGGDYQILVKVKSKKSTDEKFDEIHGRNKGNSGGMTLSIFDNTGLPIADLAKFTLHFGEKDKVIYLLENEGEEDFLKFTVDISYGTEIYKNGLPENITSLEIGSELSDYTPPTSSTNNKTKVNKSTNKTKTSNTVSNSGKSENWDKILKSYEEYIDEYIKFYKKAKDGDATAMSSYPQLMQKAQNFSNKLSNAGDELTPTQMAKFTKLQMKLASVAAGL